MSSSKDDVKANQAQTAASSQTPPTAPAGANAKGPGAKPVVNPDADKNAKKKKDGKDQEAAAQPEKKEPAPGIFSKPGGSGFMGDMLQILAMAWEIFDKSRSIVSGALRAIDDKLEEKTGFGFRKTWNAAKDAVKNGINSLINPTEGQDPAKNSQPPGQTNGGVTKPSAANTQNASAANTQNMGATNSQKQEDSERNEGNIQADEQRREVEEYEDMEEYEEMGDSWDDTPSQKPMAAGSDTVGHDSPDEGIEISFEEYESSVTNTDTTTNKLSPVSEPPSDEKEDDLHPK